MGFFLRGVRVVFCPIKELNTIELTLTNVLVFSEIENITQVSFYNRITG